jgi:hypothetical protein
MMISLQKNPMLAIKLGPMAESRLYKIAHLQSFAIRALLALFKPTTLPDHAIIESDQRVISRPAIVLQLPKPHISRYRQAAACPRAAQNRRCTEVSVPHKGSAGAVQVKLRSNAGGTARSATSATCLQRATLHRKATAMHVLSILQGDSLKAIGQQKEKCEKTEAAAEEMVRANADAVFESACRSIVMRSPPGWMDEICTEHLQAV